MKKFGGRLGPIDGASDASMEGAGEAVLLLPLDLLLEEEDILELPMMLSPPFPPFPDSFRSLLINDDDEEA